MSYKLGTIFAFFLNKKPRIDTNEKRWIKFMFTRG
jgi:hypothetical protein